MVDAAAKLSLLNSPLVAFSADGLPHRPVLPRDWRGVLQSFGFDAAEVEELQRSGTVSEIAWQ